MVIIITIYYYCYCYYHRRLRLIAVAAADASVLHSRLWQMRIHCLVLFWYYFAITGAHKHRMTQTENTHIHSLLPWPNQKLHRVKQSLCVTCTIRIVSSSDCVRPVSNIVMNLAHVVLIIIISINIITNK